MELAYPWRDSDCLEWLRTLSLPTLPWVNQFLFLMGLPKPVAEQPQVWQSIYARAMMDYETCLETRDWEIGTPGGRAKLEQQIVKKALLELAAQSGLKVAVELEQWVLLHFFCGEFRAAMFSWQPVLTGTYRQPRPGRKPIILPVVLASLIPEIKNLVSYELRNEIRNNLRNVAPPPPECLNPDERSDECFEVLLIYEAIEQTLTVKALQKIAKAINETERKEVMAWVEMYAQNRKYLIQIEKLCGDKYLQVEQPRPRLPSILDNI
ncbi:MULTISPECIES: hypothetical protein [unclassified Microcoleus]|uniref:hypothetical protein n=1 Tax=unclassified Microcoleus TaxID=2642155 RepID=UPI002FD28688